MRLHPEDTFLTIALSVIGVSAVTGYYVVTHMGGRQDYMDKTKVMDDSLPGRPLSGQITVRTKENDCIRENADFAASLR